MLAPPGVARGDRRGGGDRREEPAAINYDHVPNATYSDPEVASVGLTEAAARARGYKVKVAGFRSRPRQGADPDAQRGS